VRGLDELQFEGGAPLALAAEVNNLDAIKALVAGGADPNIPTSMGTTLIDARNDGQSERAGCMIPR
jgi:ankyrin repeat protein